MSKIQTHSKKYKIICSVLLAVMIIVQLGIITFYMAEKKVGYHMDELWSYGLSNSYYHPHLYAREEVAQWDTHNEWHDEDFFKNYLSVGNDERFEYGSVYYNQKNDVHPPLYYYILHTICSFFPDSFSPWYAFAINAVSFIVSQIFLYLCVLKISKSEILALAVCAMWGFSTGAITCHIYLRMYAMLMALTLVYTYLNLKMLYDGFSAKRLAALCVITYLGSLTQYFFIIYAGAMAACLCIYYLMKKKFKQLFAYGGFLLLSVGLAVVSFPVMITHILMDNDIMGLHATFTQHKTFALQMHFIIRYMVDEITGIDMTLIKSPILSYLLCVLVGIAAIGLPLGFLFRNETWFKAFLLNIKKGAISAVKFVRSKIGFSVAVLLMLAISASSIFVINALVSPIALMKEKSSHYSVQVYPLVIAVVMCAVFMFLRSIPNKLSKSCTPVALAVCVGCVLGSRFGCEVNYLFDDNFEGLLQTRLGDLSENCDIILLVDGSSTIHYYPYELYNADSLFAATTDAFEDCAVEYDKAGADGNDVYLVLDEDSMLRYIYTDQRNDLIVHQANSSGSDEEVEQSVETLENLYKDNKVIDFFEENTRFENVEYIGSRRVFGYINYVYKLS